MSADPYGADDVLAGARMLGRLIGAATKGDLDALADAICALSLDEAHRLVGVAAMWLADEGAMREYMRQRGWAHAGL